MAKNTRILEDILNNITLSTILDFANDTLHLGIKSTVRKADLIKEVIQEANEVDTQLHELVKFVNSAQSWGKQHIFLFRSTPQHRQKFKSKNENEIQKILNKKNIQLSLNNAIPLFIPPEDGFKIFNVKYIQNQRLAIAWAEKRTSYSRVFEEDYFNIDKSIEYRAYKGNNGRGILTLDWDLTNGQMLIGITQSTRKQSYNEGKEKALKFMSDIFSVDGWKPINIKKSITQIKNLKQVSTKKFDQVTNSGGKQSLQAKSKDHDIEADPELKSAERAIQRRYSSTYGNFFWLPNQENSLKNQVHTIINSKTNSILIYGLQTESTVRYIIGQIIRYSR